MLARYRAFYFRKYLSIVRILSVVNLPLGVIGTFGDFRDFTTYLFLLPFLCLDLLFIILFFNEMKFKKMEIILCFLIFISVIVGVLNNELSRRILTDFTGPIFFILKIVIFRSYFKSNMSEEYLASFMKKLAKYLIVSGLFSLVLFFALSRLKPMYSGITPITHPYLTLGLMNGSLFKQVLAFSVALLSGKRALLISSIIIILCFKFLIQKKVKAIVLFSFGSFLIVIIGLNLGIDLNSISAIEKYKWTYETFKSSKVELTLKDDDGIMGLLTAGRSSEVASALSTMETEDYFLGKGVGFTYTLASESLEESVTGYSNVHFTPLSLITKYGVIFTFLFIFYIFNSLKGFKYNGALAIFFGLYVIGVLVDMLFAYVIFVDPILPLALGFLVYRKQKNEFQRSA